LGVFFTTFFSAINIENLAIESLLRFMSQFNIVQFFLKKLYVIFVL
jgi:hypothetical protein